MCRYGGGHRYGFFDMKLTLPAIIEQAECRIVALLEFCNDEARANCMKSFPRVRK